MAVYSKKMTNKPTLHVISLPHTQSTKEYMPCAYTQKIIKFCDMMSLRGYSINLYASEDNEAACTEFHTCITKKEQRKLIGGKDWKRDFFTIFWDASLPYWQLMNTRAIEKIKKTIQKKDIICLIGGHCQKPIAEAFPDHIIVEFGVGYKGIFAKHRVFESYAWMHYVYGLSGIEHGLYYDAVIPNYYNENDFYLDKKEDYYLYVGRLVNSKGIAAAVDTCRVLNTRLVIAGQGVLEARPGYLKSKEFEITYPKLEYVGVLDAKKRAYFMARAKALFCPTQYIGPFEGVHVEAMLSGTPVITTDWGVFSETVINGFNGYRTRSLQDMVKAAMYCEALDGRAIRQHAIENYSLEPVSKLFDEYFKRLDTLWDQGWYSLNHEYSQTMQRPAAPAPPFLAVPSCPQPPEPPAP